MQTVEQIQERIQNELNGLNIVKEPKLLYEPIEYGLSSGGKRLRPVLVLLSTEMFGGDINNSIFPAIGVEVFHNFTLLHDDIMDNAPIRRNRPTVYKKWNENVAILSGDAMLIQAYTYVANCDDRWFGKVIRVFNDIAMKVCEGQQYDMDFEERLDVSVQEYIYMIELKTAVLLAGSLKVGAIIADASENDINSIYEYGRLIGLAFQLQDDYLDVFADQDKFGKKIGGDIVSNKKTFLLISALANANNDQLEELNKWLSIKDLNHESKVNSVTDLYKQIGVDKLCLETIEDYYNKANLILDKINIPSERKSELIKFSKSLLQRDF